MPTSQTKKKPAKKPTDRQPKSPTSAKGWKRQGTTDLLLPSGNVCRVRRPGMEKILSSGVMPDNLTKIAMDQIDAAKAPGKKSGEVTEEDNVDAEVLRELMGDPEKLEGMFLSFDKITAMCVVEPKVRLHQYTETDERAGQIPAGYSVGDEIPFVNRDEDILYTDDVDMDDKTFIFQFVVGGSSDLEQFRNEYGDALATLQDGGAVEDETK